MKVLLVLVCLVLAVTAGAVGGLLVANSSSIPAPVEELAARPAPAAVEAHSRDALAQRVDALNMQVADLQAELTRLKEGQGRAPAVALATPASSEPETPAAFAAQHKDAILQVIAKDRELQQKQREDERKQRELEAISARADRAAKKFNLTPDQQKALTDVYTLERQKMEDARGSLGADGGFRGDPETIRDAIRDLRDWRTNELNVRLGEDLAKKINDFDNDRFRGGRAFGGNRGNGQPGQTGNGNDGN